MATRRPRPSIHDADHLELLLDRLATAMGRGCSPSSRLRQALRLALTRDPPFQSVAKWAEEGRVRRNTLWRDWRVWRGSARLQDVVDAILLTRAVAARAREPDWVGVALHLGVHEHTLARIARRLLARSLPQLHEEPLLIGSGLCEILRVEPARVVWPPG